MAAVRRTNCLALIVGALALCALRSEASYSRTPFSRTASFANLQVCFGTTVPACLDVHDFDVDGQSDGVINIDDFDGFAQCFNEPDFAPLPGCELAPPKFRGTPPETGLFTLHGRPIDVLPDGKVLMDFRTRIYDPQHGRWLQRDRAGYADGQSLYEAFKTNPQTFTDPHGTDVWVTADAKEVTDATGREWWEITYTRHRNKLDVGYVFTFYQWWWGDWDNPNFSETETIVEYFPRRQGINIWNRIAAEQERLVEDFTANADAKAYRDAIVVAASAPIQIATAGTAQTLVASGAAKIGVTSSTALGRIAISSATNALVTGVGEAGVTAVLVPFCEATLAEVGEAGLRGLAVGGITGATGRVLAESSPTLQRGLAALGDGEFSRRVAAYDIREARAILQQAGIPVLERNQIIRSFKLSSFRLSRTGATQVEFRYFDDFRASLRGRYTTPEFIPNQTERIVRLALLSNAATRIGQVSIPKGTVVIRGIVAEQPFPGLTGGARQTFILGDVQGISYREIYHP